jgi:hypothetical protein
VIEKNTKLSTDKLTLISILIMVIQLFAPVAQLDRALPSGGKGRGFESRRVRQFVSLT